jgi:hypothetical protein
MDSIRQPRRWARSPIADARAFLVALLRDSWIFAESETGLRSALDQAR